MTSAPSARRALATLGACLAMMIVFLAACTGFSQPPALTWVSALSSVIAVLAPTAVAFFWPRAGAPGAPPYVPISRWVVIGVGCCSLPLYFLLAGIQVAIGMHMRVHPAGTASQLLATGPVSLLWIWVAIAVLPALAEELLFRGMVQQAAVARLGAMWGIVASAALFSFMHGEVVGFLPRLLMGLWFGFLFWRTGSLWASTAAHMLNNSWALGIANSPTGIESHLAAIALASLLGLGCGLLAFRRAGLIGDVSIPSLQEGLPAMPRVIAVQRPEPYMPEERPAGERAD